VRKEADVTLRDDLLNYMARNGRDAIGLERHNVVIIGETHGYLKEAAGVRTTATVRLVRELLTDPRFRYFGSEYFQNAGPIRHAVRDYWERAALAPRFDNTAPGADDMDAQEVGRRVTPRWFQPVLDDLRARPRHVLSIGSRVNGLDVRDRRLAQHFFEEVSDRGIARGTPGVLLLGAAHAAATPFDRGQTTTRMILEHRGYRCTSIFVITDFAEDGGDSDDTVVPLASGTLPRIRLGSLTLPSRICFSTRASRDSPFFRVRNKYSHSGQSLAEQYEFVVLQRG
jgi:hypothetical protein